MPNDFYNKIMRTGKKGSRSKKIAKQQFKKAEDNVISASVTVLGSPNLEEREIVQLKGLGLNFSGRWRIKGYETTLDNSQGYISVIKIDRNAPKGQTSKSHSRVPGKAKVVKGIKSAPTAGREFYNRIMKVKQKKVAIQR